jgi:hypothetical protein
LDLKFLAEIKIADIAAIMIMSAIIISLLKLIFFTILGSLQ